MTEPMSEAQMIIAHTMRSALEATIDDALMHTVMAAQSSGLNQDAALTIVMGALASSMVAMSSARVSSANGVPIADGDDNPASYENMTVAQVHNANRMCMQSVLLSFQQLMPKQMEVILSAAVHVHGGSEMASIRVKRLDEELKDGNV